MNVPKMAWRNVWRNRRRSMVTIAAMTLALVVELLYSGLVTGMQEPTITSLLIQIWGSRNLATLRSVFAAGMVFSSGLAPAVFGLLLDAGIAFTTILLLMVAGLW